MNLQQRYSAGIWEIKVWDPRGNLGLTGTTISAAGHREIGPLCPLEGQPRFPDSQAQGTLCCGSKAPNSKAKQRLL